VTLQALGRSVLLMVEDGSTVGPLFVASRDLDVGGRGIMIVQVLSRDWGVSVDGGWRQVGVGGVRHPVAPTARRVTGHLPGW
jgi:hypothetical protein